MNRCLLLCLCLGTTFAACKAEDPYAGLPFHPADATSAPDPSKMGPYPVGVVTLDGLFDSSRTDQWGNPRHLVSEVWYPATDAAIGKPGKVYNVEDLMTDQERSEVQAKGISVPLLETVAVENAEPRLQGAPYPLVIFSHGQAGIRWQSTFYTVALASHGYIVVAPDHPGDTLQDAFDLGNDPPLLDSFVDRELDVAFLISYFTCTQYPSLVKGYQCMPSSDILNGLVSHAAGSPIGVTGHSYGALTSLRAGILDSRVKAIVPQAPTSAAEALIDLGAQNAVIKTPSLIEGAGKDQTLKEYCDNSYEAYTQTSKPRAIVDILGGGHFTYSVLCQFNLGPVANSLGFVNVSNVINDGCGPSAPSAAVAEPIMNNYAVGFFNWQLRGSKNSLKYLSQTAGEALTPGFKTPCTPDPTCDPSLNCCNLDGSTTCCVKQYDTNIYAGQSTCSPGQTCDPTEKVCEVVGFQSDF
jgi:dienelactone hydrolase